MSKEIIVRKDGSSALQNATADGLDRDAAAHIINQHVLLRAEGFHTVEVSSGAVLAAKGLLRQRGIDASRFTLKTLAMIGVPDHFGLFQDMAAEHGLVVASSLSTEIELADKAEGGEIKGGMGEALRHDDILLVCNFHDEASSREMDLYRDNRRVFRTESSENDFHSVNIAKATGADILMLCTGADGFMVDGKKLDKLHVDDIDDLMQYCGPGSTTGTGDMRTKLLAAKEAAIAGISTVIGNYEADSRAILNDNLGTWVVQ